MFNFVSTIAKSLSQTQAPATTTAVTPRSNNPFCGGHVFINSEAQSSKTYAKNRPLEGGYFAGYYNGKPNIVGKKLFIEV